MTLKAPLTFNKQIERLKTHGISIANEEFAKKILTEINYYRFTGYALQFRKAADNSDCIEGTSFESIYDIYKFDEELRNLSRKYLEKVEIFFRTQISYFFSQMKCTLPPYNQHYDDRNYCNIKWFNEVKASFNDDKKYYEDSLVFKHHKKNYSYQMPLWVIVEYLSFSNLSKLYNSMDITVKNKIAAEVGTGSDMLSNHLHCLTVFRNKTAHAARLYNETFSPPARHNKSFLQQHPSMKNDSFFSYFIVLIKRLPTQEEKKACADSFKSIIEKYKKKSIDMSFVGIPDNYADILDIIKV